MKSKKSRLKEIEVEMKSLVRESYNDAEGPHSDADALLIEAARLCGVPEEILNEYEKVEKWFA